MWSYGESVQAMTCQSQANHFRLAQQLEGDFAHPHVLVHDEVANEGIKRVLERGRLVLFEKEMADPCKAVSCWSQSQQKLVFAGGQGVDDYRHHQAGSCEMEASADVV